MDNQTTAAVRQGAPSGGFKRKTILIKKGLQYRYMALILFSVLLGFLIVGLEITWNLSRIIAAKPAYLGIVEELWQGMPIFALKTVMYLVIVLIVSSVISHKMAGPIFKFEKSAGVLAGGDLTHRVYLRKGDQLLELQDEFNKMAASLQEKVKADRAAADAAVEKLKAIAARTQDPELKEEINKAAASLGGISMGFKV